MKTSETSMDFIGGATNTIVIGSECGHGLKKDEQSATKLCKKCGRTLPLSAFNKNSKSKDGLQYECRECHAEVMKRYHIKKAEELKKTGMVQYTDMAHTTEHKLIKVYAHPELAKFHPRQLMEELKARGWRWEYMLEPQKKIYFDKI